jgi:hypothetical protein
MMFKIFRNSTKEIVGAVLSLGVGTIFVHQFVRLPLKKPESRTKTMVMALPAGKVV